MKWIEKICKKRLAGKAAQINRQPRITPLREIRRVGIIWHENDQKAFSFLQEYFRKRSVIIRHLCYSDIFDNGDPHTISKKDFNWLGFPASSTVETFLEMEFDLLINVNINPCFHLEVLTALSMALFKIGWDREKSGYFDLSIEVPEDSDSCFLAEQMIRYLQKFAK